MPLKSLFQKIFSLQLKSLKVFASVFEIIFLQILRVDDYLKLMNTSCTNYEVKKAFVFSLYTGLRWIDVKSLKWENLKEKSIMLQQPKTGINLEIPLHEIALRILGGRKTGPIFHLPSPYSVW